MSTSRYYPSPGFPPWAPSPGFPTLCPSPKATGTASSEQGLRGSDSHESIRDVPGWGALGVHIAQSGHSAAPECSVWTLWTLCSSRMLVLLTSRGAPFALSRSALLTAFRAPLRVQIVHLGESTGRQARVVPAILCAALPGAHARSSDAAPRGGDGPRTL